jgi:putative peptidoglycan lipid II flippase
VRLERSLSVRWDLQSAAFRQVMRNAGPAVMGRGVVQLSAYIDMGLASFLFSGAVAVLSFAQTLYVLPVSLFGMAVAAAELPEMSREAAGRIDALRARLTAGQERIVFFVIPAAVAYLIIGDVIVGALYQWGEFRRADTLIVYAVLAAYTTGLLASTSARLYASALYAVHDTRTPARIAMLRVIIAAATGAVLMFALERFAIRTDTLQLTRNVGDAAMLRPLGAAGLALGSGVAAWIEFVLLRRSVQARLGTTSAVSSVVARLLLAALIPAALLRLLVFVLPRTEPRLLAVLTLPVFGLGYLLLGWALGVARSRDMVRQTLRRIGLIRNGPG